MPQHEESRIRKFKIDDVFHLLSFLRFHDPQCTKTCYNLQEEFLIVLWNFIVKCAKLLNKFQSKFESVVFSKIKAIEKSRCQVSIT